MVVKITGAVPRQSVPDPVVRAANEVEVVVWHRRFGDAQHGILVRADIPGEYAAVS